MTALGARTGSGRDAGRRLALTGIAAGTILVGVWATFWPRRFYDDFLLGRGWVAADGPYNAHLVGDVGSLTLALAVVVVAALRRGDRGAVRTAGLATVAYALPHTVYHLSNLGPFGALDASLIGGLVSMQLVLGAWLALSPVSPRGA